MRGCCGGGVHGCSWGAGGMRGRGGMRGEGGVCMAKVGIHVERGACMVKGGCAWQRWGGMHGKGGHVWQRGACVAKGGRAWYTPRDTAGHCAGGTHPTGMHSCW